MDLLTWLIVGLVAGVLASFVMGGVGYGLIGDIIIGIVGAFVGGWLFGVVDVSSPFSGLAGTIFTAFVGAVVLLFALRLIRSATSGGGGTWRGSAPRDRVGWRAWRRWR